MTGADILGMIGPISTGLTAIAAIGACLISWRNRSAIQDVHVSINSRMDELLRVTAQASRAEGVAEGAQTAKKP
jgi:hypothetical protein